MSNNHETILYVNLKTLEDNYNYLKNTYCKQNKIIAVVKAYAYGLGDIEIAKKLESLDVDGFWVADFEEGVRLRKHGIVKPIMVANPGFKSRSMVLKHDLEPIIYNQRLLDLYCTDQTPVKIHLKFNTGMNRYGFDVDELNDVIKIVQSYSHLTVRSICSHLSSSNDPAMDIFSKQQLSQLETINNRLKEAFGYSFPKHILNSNGVLRMKSNSSDWVRLGIGLFGGVKHDGLSPIFTLKSVVNQIREVQAGNSIGYQHSFTAICPMKIAVIPVGYADGLNRTLGHSKGYVIINHLPCPILGEISMDSMVVDVSNVNAKEGDEVIIFSTEHSVVELSSKVGTIPYEIMATLNRRIKRVYLNE